MKTGPIRLVLGVVTFIRVDDVELTRHLTFLTTARHVTTNNHALIGTHLYAGYCQSTSQSASFNQLPPTMRPVRLLLLPNVPPHLKCVNTLPREISRMYFYRATLC